MLNMKWMDQSIAINKNGLLVPLSYLKAGEKEINEIFNGCGSEGIIEKIIPDNILGVDISECCSIHDWMFHFSRNVEDFKVSDKLFKLNLDTQLGKKKTFLKAFIAKLYSLAVRVYSSIKISLKN